MLSDIDREKLNAAQQVIDLAQQSIADLCKAENPLLAEQALELLEPLAKMNLKLQRTLTITKEN